MHGFAVIDPNPWMMLPFAVLLGMIAVGPLWFPNWWLKHYPKVAVVLGSITLVYYLFVLKATEPVLHTAHEYVSFIALIGSLYVVSGGIHINVKGEATPMGNVIFLLIGAVISNFLGTTGASMLLIRPWLRMNKYRVTAHHVVFFIFIVSNVGGCLTPIGDPPLFLGYLKGVPFWWVAEHCWPMWALGIAILLAMFYVVDVLNFKRAPKRVRAELTQHEEWRFEGGANVLFLAVILVAVFIKNPPFLREALMIGAAIASYFVTKKEVHNANDFNFHPIQEVAILFIGIFATMMPTLHWLEGNSAKLGKPTPSLYYWSAGTLSGFLDNAPTYLSFLSAIEGTISTNSIAEMQAAVAARNRDSAASDAGSALAKVEQYYPAEYASGTISAAKAKMAMLLGDRELSKFLLAISIASVFFGANTYIGNGPNFMVKAIADHQKVNTPTFVAYVLKYTLPFMLPMLLIVWLVFFRR